MYRVRLINEELQDLVKPEIGAFSRQSIGSRDVLICCAGFEDRSLRALEIASAEEGREFTCILIEYLPFSTENRYGEFINLFSRASGKLVELKYSRQCPAGFGEKLCKVLREESGDIFIDVSGMSRFLIVQLLVAMGRDFHMLNRMNVVYTEALRYFPSREEFDVTVSQSDRSLLYEIFFLSSGVIDLMLIPELSSIALQGQPVRLIAFPSFNVDQLAALRGEVQPSFSCLLNGIPPKEGNKWRSGAISKLNHVDRIVRCEEHDVSTFDYRETLDLLIEIFEKYGRSEKLVISPTGSKLQAVAVAIFKIFMDDVQVVYPVPKKFVEPKKYTDGGKSTFLLPLKNFSDL